MPGGAYSLTVPPSSPDGGPTDKQSQALYSIPVVEKQAAGDDIRCRKVENKKQVKRPEKQEKVGWLQTLGWSVLKSAPISRQTGGAWGWAPHKGCVVGNICWVAGGLPNGRSFWVGPTIISESDQAGRASLPYCFGLFWVLATTPARN